MSDAAVMVVGFAMGLALAAAVGVGYRWSKRRIAGRGLAVVPMPAEDWTDDDVDRLLAALQSPDDDDEHAEAFI